MLVSGRVIRSIIFPKSSPKLDGNPPLASDQVVVDVEKWSQEGPKVGPFDRFKDL